MRRHRRTRGPCEARRRMCGAARERRGLGAAVQPPSTPRGAGYRSHMGNGISRVTRCDGFTYTLWGQCAVRGVGRGPRKRPRATHSDAHTWHAALGLSRLHARALHANGAFGMVQWENRMAAPLLVLLCRHTGSCTRTPHRPHRECRIRDTTWDTAHAPWHESLHKTISHAGCGSADAVIKPI